MDKSFLLMFTMQELIIAGIVLAVIIMILLLVKVFSRKSKRKELELAEEEADFYCDLYYGQVMKEAKLKYKAYVAKGYVEKLPTPMEAIGKDRQMKELLDQTDDPEERRKILEEYLPIIMLSLARGKAEGLEGIPSKEATQLKRLLREYFVNE